MAVPARRVGKTRKKLRRTHFKLDEECLIKCSHCGEFIHSHCICQYCGYYKGKLILNLKNKKTDEKQTNK